MFKIVILCTQLLLFEVCLLVEERTAFSVLHYRCSSGTFGDDWRDNPCSGWMSLMYPHHVFPDVGRRYPT